MNWQTAKSEWSCRANSRPERPGPPGPGPNRPWAAFLILIVAGLTCLSGPVGAQEQTAEPVEVPAVAVERQTDTDESGTDESDGTDVSDLEGSGDYLGGAPLKTDPDLMSQLKRAEQYRSEGNWRVVAKLWQSVLDQSGDTLFSNDGETYFALTRRIESMLSELPPEGLSAYRISADADASEILAAAGKRHDLEALGRIVKGYFMSSLGDDAAFQLGCIYLDRYDFSGAIRMFTKIVDHYPDPSIPLEQVWLRIAVCYAYTGDSRSAGLALDQATGLGADDTDRLYQEVVALVEQSPDVDSAAGMQSGSWPGRLGGPRRLGLMPAPPDPPSGKLRALWQFWFSPRDQYLRDQYAGGWLGSEGKPVIENTVDTPEERVVNNWREGKWRPAGSVLFAQDKVLWKSGADLIAFDRQVLENQQPVWRTLWLNQFLVDEATETWKQMVDAYGRYGDEPREKRRSPTKTQEIQLFGDRIAQSMSIHRNAVYSIEGTEYSSLDK